MATGAVPDPEIDVQALTAQAIGLMMSDPLSAEALARRVLEVAPDSTDARLVLGSCLRSQRAFEAAEPILTSVVAAQPASWVAKFELAQVVVAQGRSRDAAALLVGALELNPGLAAGWRLLGDIRLVAGDVGAAQAAYDRLLGCVIPEPRLRGPAGALAEGRLDDAERSLRQAPADHPAALHLMAEVLARQGRLPEAEALLAACLARAPGLMLARHSHALLLMRTGQHRAALAELDQVLERDPPTIAAG